jgi:hypothetical protein
MIRFIILFDIFTIVPNLLNLKLEIKLTYSIFNLISINKEIAIYSILYILLYKIFYDRVTKNNLIHL